MFIDETRGGFIIQLVQARGDLILFIDETGGGITNQLVKATGDYWN